MAQREPELPEGTDQIIEGTGAAEGATFTPGSDTAFSSFKTQLRDTGTNLRGQATDRVRSYAVDGKDRATNVLDDVAKAITDAAGSVDDRLGADYGDYARRAADALQSFSETLRKKDVDEIYQDAAELVRKSPAAAVGIAAAIGFAVVRLAKAGLEDNAGTQARGKTSGRKSDTEA